MGWTKLEPCKGRTVTVADSRDRLPIYYGKPVRYEPDNDGKISIRLSKEDWQYIIDNLNYILREEPEYKDLITLRDKLIKGIS